MLQYSMSISAAKSTFWILTDEDQVHGQLGSRDLQPIILLLQSFQLLLINLRYFGVLISQ